MSDTVFHPNFTILIVESGKQGIIGSFAADNTLFSGIFS